jgi:hypothetical protein
VTHFTFRASFLGYFHVLRKYLEFRPFALKQEGIWIAKAGKERESRES